MTAAAIRIGSRGSALALAQARLVADALAEAGRDADIVVIETAGDRRAPDTAWGEGAFVAAIELALLDDRVDVAVHSAKDVPTDEDPRLTIAAYLPRADPRDALVLPAGSTVAGLSGLPSGARVGTDSPRRTGFLRAHRPDLVIQPLHGNVDTRLRRLDEGEVDVLVLACAGLDRLGRADRITERIDSGVIPPAPGQGAIAIQVRAADHDLRERLKGIDDGATRAAVEAERAFLRATGGGCRAPIGALATVSGPTMTLRGGVAEPDGSAAEIAEISGPLSDPALLGRRLAVRLGLVPARDGGRRVLVTRPPEQSLELVRALRDAGLRPVVVPTIEVVPAPPAALRDAIGRLSTYQWVVVTSANAVRALAGSVAGDSPQIRKARWTAVGRVTRAALAAAGADAAFVPATSNGAALAADLPFGTGDRVLVVRGDLADSAVATTLRARGAEVDELVAYRTIEAPVGSRQLVRDAMEAGAPSTVVFTSGSTARGLAELGASEGLDLASIGAVCIGDETAAAATRAGFHVVAVAGAPTVAALVEATVARLSPQLQETR